MAGFIIIQLILLISALFCILMLRRNHQIFTIRGKILDRAYEYGTNSIESDAWDPRQNPYYIYLDEHEYEEMMSEILIIPSSYIDEVEGIAEGYPHFVPLKSR